jgi:large subunit ribosomal protein L4
MKVNKKARRAALAGVLSQRSGEGQLVVLESLTLPEAKTKSFLQRLDRLGLAGEKVLFIDGLENLNLYLASRNRPELLALDPRSVNAYEVLNHRWIVTTQDGLKALAEVLS